MKFTKEFLSKMSVLGLLVLCFMTCMTGEVRAEYRYDFYIKGDERARTDTVVLLKQYLNLNDEEATQFFDESLSNFKLIKENMVADEYYPMAKSSFQYKLSSI